MADVNIDMRFSVVETDQLDRLKQQMDRIEFKFDKLLEALSADDAGADDEEGAARSLDDGSRWLPRDPNESLG
jgi:hypothetical protein